MLTAMFRTILQWKCHLQCIMDITIVLQSLYVFVRKPLYVGVFSVKRDFVHHS